MILDHKKTMREIPKEIRDTFPYAGDVLIFSGVPERYYPMYLDMGKKAKEQMVIGQKYTIKKVEIYSSWCAVWLEGWTTDDYFNLSFFKQEDSISKGSAYKVY